MSDDLEQPNREWMERRGWRWDDFLNFSWDLGDGTSLLIDLVDADFQIVHCDEYEERNSVCVAVQCETRGDVRRIERVFQIKAREGLL
jgi:hypothetical protein